MIIADMDVAEDGSLYVGGSFGGNVTLASTMFNAGSSDAYLAKMSYPIAVEELTTPVTPLVLMNPAHDQLIGWVNSSLPVSSCELRIFDCSGKLVKTSFVQTNSFKLDVSSLSAGCYFAEVFAGDQLMHGKFIKQ